MHVLKNHSKAFCLAICKNSEQRTKHKMETGLLSSKSIREQSLSIGETGGEGDELGSEIFMHVGTEVCNL